LNKNKGTETDSGKAKTEDKVSKINDKFLILKHF
jgi:hypothetical protein